MATSCMAFKYTTLSTSCGPGSTSAQRAADWGLVLKTGSETETIWSFSGGWFEEGLDEFLFSHYSFMKGAFNDIINKGSKSHPY